MESSSNMTKKRLILHIGSHKTATTFIQGSLAKNTAILSQLGILYPESGKIYDAHFKLCWKLRNQEFANTPLTNIPDWAELIAEIQASPAMTAIVSAEEFGLSINPQRLAPLMDIFDVQIVYYLRSPESFMESFYNQFVKDFITRETRTINTYLAEERVAFLNPRAILEPWVEVFGVDRISLRLFSKTALKNGILADFFKTIGYTEPTGMQPPEVSVLHKVSLPSDALEYLRVANTNLTQEQGHHPFVVKVVQIAQLNKAELETTRAGVLSLKARENLRHRFAGPNIWAAETFWGNSTSPFMVQDTPPPPADFHRRPETADAATIGRVAAMIQNHLAQQS